jgi:hypothetical protein
MSYWIVDGRELTNEQYEELERQEELEKQKAHEEGQRLRRQLGEAFAALKDHLERTQDEDQQITDERARDQQIYQNLWHNLEKADKAPRCSIIKEDGTSCRSPKLKDDICCYAHYRMREARPKKLDLATQDDANCIQMAIMQTQRALIDGEISEKMGGLLLYSLQIAAANVDRTTFGQANDEDMVTETVEEEERVRDHQQEINREKRLDEIQRNNHLPLTTNKDTDGKTGEQSIPRINRDQSDADQDKRTGKMLPQIAGSEVYANRDPISEVHANLG